MRNLMIKIRLTFSTLLVLTLSLFAIEINANDADLYFGLRATGEENRKLFEITGYKNGISYNPGHGFDDKIYGYAEISRSRIKIEITNNSDIPLKKNFFLDQFMARTLSGKTFNLNKGQITDYPKYNFINPGRTISFNFYNNIPYEEVVSFIVVGLNGDINNMVMFQKIPYKYVMLTPEEVEAKKKAKIEANKKAEKEMYQEDWFMD